MYSTVNVAGVLVYSINSNMYTADDERRQATPVALLITVIGRVIIQLGRLTDRSVNELTRRGPVRELESPGRTRRAGAVATSAATAGARAAPAASTGRAATHDACHRQRDLLA